jgi:polyferredoxin
VLGVYMNDHCPVFVQKSIHLTHIHDRSFSCLCTDIDTPNRTMISHIYVLGVSMSVQRQDNDRSCICVRCIDVCAKTGQ